MGRRLRTILDAINPRRMPQIFHDDEKSSRRDRNNRRLEGTPQMTEEQQAALAALKAWFEMQSSSNVNNLYNAAAKLFGSNFDPRKYDDVP